LTPALVALGLGALVVGAYWTTLFGSPSGSPQGIVPRWHEAQYSHGYLVPVFAAYLLWARRPMAAGPGVRLSLWGLPLLVAGGALHWAGGYYNLEWVDGASLAVSAAGVLALAGGPRWLVWGWPAAASLLFMVPLPYRVEHALAYPLQRLAAVGSTYVMQTLGLPAVAEGNVIALPSGRVNVVEACSGLSMLMIFVALSAAVAVVARRPLLDRLVVLASAVPIALAANVLRITTTGLIQEARGPEAASGFHNSWPAAALMMVFALALMGAELWVLKRTLPEEAAPEPLPGPGAAAPPGKVKPSPYAPLWTGGARP
jgi:exosortase